MEATKIKQNEIILKPINQKGLSLFRHGIHDSICNNPYASINIMTSQFTSFSNNNNSTTNKVPSAQGQSGQSCHANQQTHVTYHSLPPPHIFHSMPHLQQIHCFSELQPYTVSQEEAALPANAITKNKISIIHTSMWERSSPNNLVAVSGVKDTQLSEDAHVGTFQP